MGDTILWLSTALFVGGTYLVLKVLIDWLSKVSVKLYNNSPRRQTLSRLRTIGAADTDEVKIEKADFLLSEFVNLNPIPVWVVGGSIVVSITLAFLWPDIGYWACVASVILLVFWWKARITRSRKIRTGSWLFVQNLHLRLMYRKNLELALKDVQNSDVTPLGAPFSALLSTYLQNDVPELFQHMARTLNLPLFFELSDQIRLSSNGRTTYWDAVGMVEKRSFEDMFSDNQEDVRATVSRLSITTIIAYLTAIAIAFGFPLVNLILKAAQ